MEKIKALFSKIDKEKVINIAAIVMAAVSVLYLLVFFLMHIFMVNKTAKYNLYFCVPLFCMIFAVGYILYLFLKKKEFKYEKVYLILAICWGITMQFVMPPISGADEPNHLLSAFHAADIMMGMKDGNRDTDSWIEGYSYFLMREDEVNGVAKIDLNLPDQYDIIANGGWFKAVGTNYVECHYQPNNAYRYIFSAFGIVIARLLGWGFSGTVMLGRFMNTLLFIFVGWFAIKIMPYGKLQAVIFSFFPAVLNLTNSYSYDNLSILLSLLLFALCLYYSKPEVKLHIWDYVILAINLILLAPNKIVYLCFGLWIFAIPFKKFWRIIVSKKWYEYVGLAGVIVSARFVIVKVFWKYTFIALKNTLWKNPMDGIEQDQSLESFSWYDVRFNPGKVINLLVKGVKTDFWYNLKHVVGCELGLVKLNAPVPLACTLIFMALIILSFVLIKGKHIPKRQFILIFIGIIVCLVAIFLGCLTRFTPSEGTDRIQVSYRYLVPIYMSLMMVFGVDAKEDKKALALLHIENLTLIFTMISILSFMIVRYYQ